ncbi:hypothetical protein BDR26DRAFT_940275 [Obelidium mucronatum]|nr:hypothetical protein BDR26DRAFT_940275 [Obelidium mucronatum]
MIPVILFLLLLTRVLGRANPASHGPPQFFPSAPRLPAAFFAAADWARAQSASGLVARLAGGGGSLGLAAEAAALTPGALALLVRTEQHVWAAQLRLRLKLVAFPTASLLDLRGGYLHASRYTSLTAAVFRLGYTSIVAGFGNDTTTSDGDVSNTVLSNVFGGAYVEITPTTPKSITQFMQERKSWKKLDDPDAIIQTVNFLTREYNVTFVSMETCLGYPVN